MGQGEDTCHRQLEVPIDRKSKTEQRHRFACFSVRMRLPLNIKLRPLSEQNINIDQDSVSVLQV